MALQVMPLIFDQPYPERTLKNSSKVESKKEQTKPFNRLFLVRSENEVTSCCK